MQYRIDDKTYNVEIVKKGNQNTYIRINDNLDIVVSTNFFTKEKQIMDMLDKNIKSIKKMLIKKENQLIKLEKFYLLGISYDIIYVPILDEIEIYNNKIYVKDEKKLNKWYKEEMLKIFSERLKYNYDRFQENIPFPKLKIRQMKTRWGVCNKRDLSITLNSNLMNYSIDKLDYVIIHELSHLIYFDHSKNFWNVVSKYCSNYKKIRNELKD